MSHIYIPIDFSDLASVIPSGQDIIYSTYAEVTFSGSNIYTARGISQKKAIWKSHVLITPQGLALNFHFKDGIEPWYVPLYNTSFLLKKLYIAHHELFENSSIDLLIIRHPEYETKASFKKRSKEFKNTIKPYKLEEWIKWVKDIYPHFEENPNYSWSDYVASHKYPLNSRAFRAIQLKIKGGMTMEKHLVTLKKKTW